jgi:hypothetical protein
LDTLQNAPINESDKATTLIQEKQIIITEIEAVTREDELALKVGFKLIPSKTAFSKVKSGLWFNNQQISAVLIRIPLLFQGNRNSAELKVYLTFPMLIMCFILVPMKQLFKVRK